MPYVIINFVICVLYIYNWIYDLELIRNNKPKKAMIVCIFNIIMIILFSINKNTNIVTNFANTFIIISYGMTSIIAIFIESLFDNRKIKYNIIRTFIFVIFVAIVLIGFRYV